MTEKELFSLQEEITEASNELAKLEGSKQTLLNQLKKDFNCDSLEKAKKKLNKYQKDLQKLKNNIDEGLIELEEKYYEEEE